MSSGEDKYGDPETRQRILEATWSLIPKHGSSLRLIDVANAAGVSRQALYLHFGDRSGLLVGLVLHMDKTLELGKHLADVFGAATGVEGLERMVELVSTYTAKIESVAQVLDAEQHHDKALAAAWRNRMDSRRAVLRTVIERIEAEGQLADEWTVEKASDLFYAVTMPGLWTELVRQVGWTPDQYSEHVTKLLKGSLIKD